MLDHYFFTLIFFWPSLCLSSNKLKEYVVLLFFIVAQHTMQMVVLFFFFFVLDLLFVCPIYCFIHFNLFTLCLDELKLLWDHIIHHSICVQICFTFELMLGFVKLDLILSIENFKIIGIKFNTKDKDPTLFSFYFLFFIGHRKAHFNPCIF